MCAPSIADEAKRPRLLRHEKDPTVLISMQRETDDALASELLHELNVLPAILRKDRIHVETGPPHKSLVLFKIFRAAEHLLAKPTKNICLALWQNLDNIRAASNIGW
jgi:hypothetical protein